MGETHRYELGALWPLPAGAGSRSARPKASTPRATWRGPRSARSPAAALLVAVGAAPTRGRSRRADLPRAGRPTGSVGCSRRSRAGEVRRIVFAVPWGAGLGAADVRAGADERPQLEANRIEGVELALVTPEEEPLQLLGRAGSEAVRRVARGARDSAPDAGSIRPRLSTARCGSSPRAGGSSGPRRRAAAAARRRGWTGLPQTLDGSSRSTPAGASAASRTLRRR